MNFDIKSGIILFIYSFPAYRGTYFCLEFRLDLSVEIKLVVCLNISLITDLI